MTVSQAALRSASAGIADEDGYILGIDMSEGQDAEWGDFTVLSEGVYGISADLSPETAVRKYVDGYRSLPVSDMARITVRLAAGAEDAAGRRLLDAARNGERLRCVYAEASGGSRTVFSLLPRIASVCPAALYGLEITVIMTV
ncbi:MAG: hypothetical protein NC120_09780 [Ruminococcus sp.]|nr:hypothetical protein [Ruminococcus sp.]